MTERTCATCGEMMSPLAQFCSQCGTPAALPTPLAPPPPTTPLPPTPPPGSWEIAGQPQTWPGQPQPPTAPQYSTAPQYLPPEPYGWPQPAAAPWATPDDTTVTSAATTGNSAGGAFAFVGAVLLAVGAFTPWVRTTTDTFSGWTASRDAKAVVGLAVLAFVVGIILVAGARSSLLRLALVAIGVTGLIISAVDIMSVRRDVDQTLNPAVGIGLVLVPLGGALLLTGAALTRTSRT